MDKKIEPTSKQTIVLNSMFVQREGAKPYAIVNVYIAVVMNVGHIWRSIPRWVLVQMCERVLPSLVFHA